MQDLAYAVDFGTSNTLVSAVSATEIFPPAPLDSHAKDPSVLRSVLYFPNQDSVFFGAEAVKEYAAQDM